MTSLKHSIIGLGMVLPIAFVWSVTTACHYDECEVSYECPPATGECRVAGCFNGTCREVFASAGAACSTGVCDGNGHCGCKSASDCAAFADDCHAPSCDQGVCTGVQQPDGTACKLDDPCGDSQCSSGACLTTALPNGTPCSMGEGECATPSICQDDRCVPDMACESLGIHGENASQDAAFDLGILDDCSEYTICDSLVPGTSDWYVYFGSDTSCAVSATVDLDSPNLLVCQYWECEQPELTVDGCPVGTELATAPNGQHGCCGTGNFAIDPCNGDFLDDGSATVWIEIREQDGEQLPACDPYSVYMEF